MPPPKRGPLRAEELGAIAEAALLNALMLLDDARCLADDERWERAFALAVLAGEEFGKVMMCLGALGRGSDDEAYWAEFWKRFTDHRPKYENILGMANSWVTDQAARERVFAQFGSHVTTDQQRKLAGLYVDYRNGQVSQPHEAVSEEDAEAAILVFGTVIEHWAESVNGDLAAKMVESEESARTMQAALATGDSDALLRAWEETAGWPDEDDDAQTDGSGDTS